MFELSGVNYEEVLEQGDSILVRVIASSSYRGFELSGLYCIYKCFQKVLRSGFAICKQNLLNLLKERPIPILNMYKRDYSNFDENEFKEAVDSLDWHSIVDINQKDPNHSLNNFYNSITYLLDEFAKKKKVTRKE